MGTIDNPSHLELPDQPSTVRQLTERLFPAYRVEEGGIHLAGCRIENRPFIRIGLWRGPVRVELFLDEHGREVNGELVRRLGLASARPVPEMRQRRWNLAPLREIGVDLLERHLGEAPDLAAVDLALVWCRYAHGKLQLTLGDRVAEVAFSDWTALLDPPRFDCPYSGRSTYHVARTDDGRIAAAEAIARCEVTGRRVLMAETVECQVTGQRVLTPLTDTCPVTGEAILRDAMVTCDMCQQLVSPHALRRNRCAACRDMKPIGPAEMPLVLLLARSPQLRKWKHWQVAETRRTHILLATGWVHRLLIVLDRETQQPVRSVSSSRLTTHWSEVRLDWGSPSGVPPTHWLTHEPAGETVETKRGRKRRRSENA